MPVGDDPILTLVHDIGPKVTRFPFVIAIKIDDEIMWIRRSWKERDGQWKSSVFRGAEGTTPAEHLEGAEIEYIRATITPEHAARAKRAGRFIQRPNGSYPHSWEDPARQDWPEMNP